MWLVVSYRPNDTEINSDFCSKFFTCTYYMSQHIAELNLNSEINELNKWEHKIYLSDTFSKSIEYSLSDLEDINPDIPEQIELITKELMNLFFVNHVDSLKKSVD